MFGYVLSKFCTLTGNVYVLGGCTSGMDADKTASIEVLHEPKGWTVLSHKLAKAVSTFAVIPLPVA
jgi:hypothetical protein